MDIFDIFSSTSLTSTYSVIFPFLVVCSFTSLVAQYCGKKRVQKGQGGKKLTGCCGCCHKKAPRQGRRKKIRSPSKASIRKEKTRPGRAKSSDYQTLANLDVDIFKKMDESKKPVTANKPPLIANHVKEDKAEDIMETQEEDATKTASLWSSDESPSDQLAEISKKSHNDAKSSTPISRRELKSLKVISRSKESTSPSIKPSSNAIMDVKKEYETNFGSKDNKPVHLKISAAENKREKQRVFKLLEKKINEVLKEKKINEVLNEEKGKDEKKAKDNKILVDTKLKQQKNKKEPSNDLKENVKIQKKKRKRSQKDDKQESEQSDTSSESDNKMSKSGTSKTEKISIMQPIVLDSEIEGGLTMSMKSEVSESTLEPTISEKK